MLNKPEFFVGIIALISVLFGRFLSLFCAIFQCFFIIIFMDWRR
jgi:hypothetical protein